MGNRRGPGAERRWIVVGGVLLLSVLLAPVLLELRGEPAPREPVTTTFRLEGLH